YRQDPHAVAGGHDVALLGGQALEHLPDLAAKAAAVLGLDEVIDAVHRDDAGRHASARIGVRAVGVGMADDGGLGRQVPLGADALAGEGRLLGEAVLLKPARPALVARRLGAVLLQLDAFLLLGHADIIPPRPHFLSFGSAFGSAVLPCFQKSMTRTAPGGRRSSAEITTTP